MKEVEPTKGLKSEKSFEEMLDEASTGESGSPSENGPTSDELLQSVAESNSIVAVALMRLYDVLMCMYAESDPEDAKRLIAEHQQGKIRSQIPWLDLDEEGKV